MGRQHRLKGVLCLAALLLACNAEQRQVDDKRRALLKPQNLMAKAATAREESLTYDAQGNLLPSTTRIAGVLLPRGYTQTLALEHEWYVDGPASLPVLERYLRRHLVVHEEKQRDDGRVEWYGAQPTGMPSVPPVYVSFYTKPGRPDRTRLQIHERTAPPVQDLPDPAVVQAQIAAQQKHAD